MENLDLVHQKSSNSQSPTHSRLAECGSRQAIQARPDHPNRVVSHLGGLPSNMQQVAPASNRPICHEVQQVALVCVAGTRFPGHSRSQSDWSKVSLYPSPSFLSKNQLAKEGPDSVAPVVIPALAPNSG